MSDIIDKHIEVLNLEDIHVGMHVDIVLDVLTCGRSNELTEKGYVDKLIEGISMSKLAVSRYKLGMLNKYKTDLTMRSVYLFRGMIDDDHVNFVTYVTLEKRRELIKKSKVYYELITLLEQKLMMSKKTNNF